METTVEEPLREFVTGTMPDDWIEMGTENTNIVHITTHTGRVHDIIIITMLTLTMNHFISRVFLSRTQNLCNHMHPFH